MACFRLFRQLLVFACIPIFALFLSGSTNAAHFAQPIQILPNAPIFSQPFAVVVSGQWPDSCVPFFHQMEVVGTIVQIEAKTPGALVVCKDEATDWIFSVPVSSLPPNEYRLDTFVISGITGISTFYAGTNFNVLGGIAILPSLPTPNDRIGVRLADLHPDGCVPDYLSHAVVGAVVTVEAETPDAVCGQIPTPWEMQVELDPLAAGEYVVELWVTEQAQKPPRRRLYASQGFSVYNHIYRNYLPQVGGFGTAARQGVWH